MVILLKTQHACSIDSSQHICNAYRLIEATVFHALFVTYENLQTNYFVVPKLFLLKLDTKNDAKAENYHYKSYHSIVHNDIDNVSFNFSLCFVFSLQQLFRSQNPNLASNTGVPPPGQPGGQPLPQTLPLPSQQYLAQQSAAYAAAAQQAAPYVINPGQDAAQYMGLIAAAGMPQYYGVAPWGVYPANLIPQQGTQPRRPLTPSQQAGENQPSYQVGFNSAISIFHLTRIFNSFV